MTHATRSVKNGARTDLDFDSRQHDSSCISGHLTVAALRRVLASTFLPAATTTLASAVSRTRETDFALAGLAATSCHQLSNLRA